MGYEKSVLDLKKIIYV